MYNTMFIIIAVFLIFEFVADNLLDFCNLRSANPRMPEKLNGIYDEKQYANQQSYLSVNTRFVIVCRCVQLMICMLLLFTGLLGRLDMFIHQHAGSDLASVILFFLIIFTFAHLLGAPSDYYRTFVIEQRFGFNRTTIKVFLSDFIKRYFLTILIGGVVLSILHSLYAEWQDRFWIYSWGIISVISVVFSMFYSELIVPLFNTQRPLKDGELRAAIESFAMNAGFPVSDIYVIDGSKRSSKANAYFTGLGGKKRIVLYDTLIKELSVDEVVAVLAHEIGHYKNHHTLIGVLLSLANSFLMFYLFSLLVGNAMLSQALGCSYPTFELGCIGFVMLFSPVEFILGGLMNLISRRNEYQADSYAASMGYACSLTSALKIISVKSLSNLTPSPCYVFFRYSHPTLLQRIENLKCSQTPD